MSTIHGQIDGAGRELLASITVHVDSGAEDGTRVYRADPHGNFVVSDLPENGAVTLIVRSDGDLAPLATLNIADGRERAVLIGVHEAGRPSTRDLENAEAEAARRDAEEPRRRELVGSEIGHIRARRSKVREAVALVRADMRDRANVAIRSRSGAALTGLGRGR